MWQNGSTDESEVLMLNQLWLYMRSSDITVSFHLFCCSRHCPIVYCCGQGPNYMDKYVRTGTSALLMTANWAIRLGTNCSHVHTALYVTRDSIFTPFVECVFLLDFLCMYLRPRGTLLELFSSVVAWASCRLPEPLTVFCDMFASVSW